MDILHFPEVQIHGNNAIVREESGYVHLGEYDTSGVFVWSPDGERRVKALEPEVDPEVASTELPADVEPVEPTPEVSPEDKLEAELAAHRAKKAAVKTGRRGR